MKEIAKYIGYYLLVYVFALAICGFFQYKVECQSELIICNFSADIFNKILTTTAYLVTPVVAIVAFLSWKHQKNFQTSYSFLDNAIKELFNFNKDLEEVCIIFIEINDDYKKDKTYHFVHSIFRKELQIEDRNLNDFYFNIKQYAKFNNDKNFENRIDEYYKISNAILFTNKHLKDECYSNIYEIILKDHSKNWYDEEVNYVMKPTNPTIIKLEKWMNLLIDRMTRVYQENGKILSYQELIEKESKLNLEIVNYMMEKMKA